MRDHREGMDPDVVKRLYASFGEASTWRWSRIRAIDEPKRKPVQTRIGSGRAGGKAGKLLRRQR